MRPFNINILAGGHQNCNIQALQYIYKQPSNHKLDSLLQENFSFMILKRRKLRLVNV